MQIKDALMAVVGTAAATALAAPAGHELHARQAPTPSLTFTGTGAGNINVVVGGGFLPTLTFGAALAAESGIIGAGVSNTIGFGGGQLPTGLLGFGLGAGIASSVAMVEASATASEGGWLNNIIPALHGGINFNNAVGGQVTSGLNFLMGGGLGGGATLSYGGNLIDPSNLGVDFGFGYGVNVNAGAIPTTSSSSSSSSSSAAPTTTPPATSSTPTPTTTA